MKYTSSTMVMAMAFALAAVNVTNIACAAGGAPPPAIGATDFLPTPGHPVGFRGDGSGSYPGAVNPTTAWMYNRDAKEGPYQNKNILFDKTSVRKSFSVPFCGFMKLGFTGMSPLLIDDKLIVTQGYAIRGLWKDTGKLAWDVKYETGWDAEAERLAYKGPALLTLADGDKALIFPQGYVIRPSDGKVLSSLTPWEMFDVPSGNVHCAIMGVIADGDTCYFSWAYGCGDVRVLKTAKDAVEFKHLWRNTIAESALSPADIVKQPPHGLSAETLIETEPLLDPIRKRLYLSVHERGLWAMDATNGNIMAHIASPR